MKRLILAACVILVANPAMAIMNPDDIDNCDDYAVYLDDLQVVIKEADARVAAGTDDPVVKATPIFYRSTLETHAQKFKTGCLENNACDEFIDTANSGRLPSGYDPARFYDVLRYLKKACGYK